jgi:hypothetical protein
MSDLDPIGKALDALEPPDERTDFFTELRERAHEQEAAASRRARMWKVGMMAVTTSSFAATGLLLALGSPFVQRAAAGDAGLAISELVSTIQDTTVVCETTTQAGARVTTVGFAPRRDGPTAKLPAILSVSSSTWGLVGVNAATIDPNNKIGIYVSPEHCKRTNARVPLARSGLPGPPIRWATGQRCIGTGRVLVRARAVWDRGGFVGYLAVRGSRTRKPIAFGAIRRDGTGSLYSSGACS